jgi:hypothetical protein
MYLISKHFAHSRTLLRRPYGLVLLSLLLSGCALLLPPKTVASKVSPQWQAPLPHQGALVQLRQWWQAQGDTLLVELQDAAQEASPGVAQATARLQSARASQAAARAALVPRVEGALAASRGQTQPATPVANALSLGAQASWELDLVGANRVVKEAADAQVQAGQAQWHDARVAVAAEVATTYFGLRACRRQSDIAARDAASRQETARLTGLLERAGMARSADLALSQASAAESRKRLTQQNADCDLAVKALVALTGLDEPGLRQRLGDRAVPPLALLGFGVTEIPAQTVSQRPDVFSAEREVVMASAAVGSAQAQRWPRLTLSGSIGALRYSGAGAESDMTTWSLGPLALSVPVFDAGQRAANVQAAEAQYAQSVVAYRAKVRAAVREVEEALVGLQSVQARSADAALALRGYTQALDASTLRYQKGMASLLELEETRRLALAAESSLEGLQLERQRAWLALYRAAGGGWEPERPFATSPAPVQSAAQ